MVKIKYCKKYVGGMSEKKQTNNKFVLFRKVIRKLNKYLKDKNGIKYLKNRR